MATATPPTRDGARLVRVPAGAYRIGSDHERIRPEDHEGPVRTVDVGADKPVPALHQDPEANPFLGLRGIRLGLARPDLLDAQLRAIVRVARDHRVRVMFPMVATLAELTAATRRSRSA